MMFEVIDPIALLCANIEVLLKMSLSHVCSEWADELACHYVGNAQKNISSSLPRKGKKELLISDNAGHQYNVTGILANQYVDPLILFEVRCAKFPDIDFTHYICGAHSAIRRRYHSICGSIVILVGSWSKSSVAMLESHDITVFLIPFDLGVFQML